MLVAFRSNMAAKRRRRAIPSKRTSAPSNRYWSARVTATSNALDLEEGVFTKPTPREVAMSLKRSADASERRKAEPFRSALSMLNFFINRAGKNLSPERRRILEQAKDELRILYGRPPVSLGRPSSATRTRTARPKPVSGPRRSRRPRRARSQPAA